MGDIPVVTVEQQKQHFFELMQLHRKCQHIVSELTQGNEDGSKFFSRLIDCRNALLTILLQISFTF